MTTKLHRLFVCTLLLVLGGVRDVGAACFAPLAAPKSSNTADWDDLVTFTPTLQVEGVREYLTVAKGFGPSINLDFYSITFRKDPNLSLEDFFFQLRRRFEFFVAGEDKSSANVFRAYTGSADPGDPLRARNENLWNSRPPTGALMSFVLESRHHTPALALRSTTGGRRLMLVMEQGDVVATCATATDFTFSTVNTQQNGLHPVSGNRGFGLKDNGNGTWTFYTKGADRLTGVASNVPYFGNLIAQFFMAPADEPAQDTIFIFGHRFWLMFFSNIMDFLDRRGMKVDRSAFVKNSNRYQYYSPTDEQRLQEVSNKGKDLFRGTTNHCAALVELVAFAATKAPNAGALLEDLKFVMIGEDLERRTSGRFYIGNTPGARGDSGFKPELRETGSPQAEHAAAAIVIGKLLSPGAHTLFARVVEAPGGLLNNPDIRLYDIGQDIGARLSNANMRQVSGVIRTTMCQ